MAVGQRLGTGLGAVVVGPGLGGALALVVGAELVGDGLVGQGLVGEGVGAGLRSSVGVRVGMGVGDVLATLGR